MSSIADFKYYVELEILLKMEDEISRARELRNELKSEETCAVCWGKIKPFSVLRSCGHIFCYTCVIRWLRCSNTEVCPLCRKDILFVVYEKENDEDFDISFMTGLREDLMAENRRIFCNSSPLNDEKVIVNQRVFELRKYLEDMRTRKTEEYANDNTYKEVVVELTTLRSILQNISNRFYTRKQLVSNLQFRHLIYEMDISWYQVVEDANPFKTSFEFGKTRSRRTQRRLLTFIQHELSVLRIPNVIQIAENILESCMIHKLYSRELMVCLRSVGVSNKDMYCFQRELKDFADSNLSLEEYWNICGYKLNGPSTADSFCVGGLCSDSSIPLIDIADEEDDDFVNFDSEDVETAEQLSSESETECELYMRKSCILKKPKRKHSQQTDVTEGNNEHLDPRAYEQIANIFGILTKPKLGKREMSGETSSRNNKREMRHDWNSYSSGPMFSDYNEDEPSDNVQKKRKVSETSPWD